MGRGCEHRNDRNLFALRSVLDSTYKNCPIHSARTLAMEMYQQYTHEVNWTQATILIRTYIIVAFHLATLQFSVHILPPTQSPSAQLTSIYIDDMLQAKIPQQQNHHHHRHCQIALLPPRCTPSELSEQSHRAHPPAGIHITSTGGNDSMSERYRIRMLDHKHLHKQTNKRINTNTQFVMLRISVFVYHRHYTVAHETRARWMVCICIWMFRTTVITGGIDNDDDDDDGNRFVRKTFITSQNHCFTSHTRALSGGF